MTANEIAQYISDNHLIEDIVHNLRVPSTYAEDLIQEMYLVVLEYDEAKLTAIYEKNQLNFWLSRVISNNWNSKTSRSYKKYRKEQTEKYDDGADLNKLSQYI